MDLVTIASTAVGILSPLVAKGIEEVGKSAMKDIYTVIKDKFSKKTEDKQALEKFEQDPSTGSAIFQSALISHLEADAEFAKRVVDVLEKLESITPGSLVGNVEAKNVVIAEKIDNLTMK